jgi:predicted PurR-regulated permease PerM
VTVGKAKAILSLVWVLLSIPLIGIEFIQTLNDNYDQWDVGLGWLIPLVLPVLSFIVATWTVTETDSDRVLLKKFHVFVTSLLASVVYLGLLYVVVLLMPRDLELLRDYIEHKMKPSSVWLGVLQGIVVIMVGKFFLEHIPDGPDHHHPARGRRSR